MRYKLPAVRHSRRVRQYFIAAILSTMVIGCGSSEDEMIRRAAMRRRQPDTDEEAETQPTPPTATSVAPAASPVSTTSAIAKSADAASATPPTPTVSQTSNPPGATATVAMKSNTGPVADDLEEFDASLLEKPTGETASTENKGTLPELVQKALPAPITKRKPTEAMNEKQKAEWSAKNLEQLGNAVKRYIAAKGFAPYRNMKSTSRSTVLSWRVSLLPYLGYQELYDRFNFEEPWDSPSNIRLLSYIPDEFVSPERFDWQTNWVGAAANSYMLGSGELEFQTIDPLADTIFFFEANDSQAVPWTKPQDCVLAQDKLKSGIGSLRATGTFTVWGDGNIGLIPSSAYWGDIHAACTTDGDEKQPASKINRAIRLEDDLEAFEDNVHLVEQQTKDAVSKPAMEAAKVTIPETPREPVPSPQQTQLASENLRRLYAEKIAKAQDRQSKVELAREMISAARELSDDAAGAYALLTAAKNLSQSGADSDALIEAVDGCVSRFDVNSVTENYEALASFGEQYKDRSAYDIEGKGFLKRSIYVIYALCLQDQYAEASNLLRHAIHFADLKKTDPIAKSLNVLRAQIASSERQYDNMKDSLAALREDASDPVANATVGRFLCFIKGDWEAGLKLLANSGTGELSELAAADLNGADDATAQLSLADSWWKMSELAKTGVYRQGSRDRAAYWYQTAMEKLPNSLDLMHAKARLNEAQTAERSSPLATLKYLADLNGLSLSESLQTIASGKQTASAAVQDDE